MKKTLFTMIMAICIIAISSCGQRSTQKKISELKIGEETETINQDLCDRIINTADGDSIVINGEKYCLEKEPVFFGIKGSLTYTLSNETAKLKVTLTAYETNSMLTGWIERTQGFKGNPKLHKSYERIAT